jgi:very-short-patch-repair endonuclease
MPLSPGEEAFALHCRAEKLQPVREFRFHPERKWRFDFAFLQHGLAVEIEGGAWNAGRHTRGSGFEADCRKYAEAAMLGWRVMRFSTQMVMSGEAIDFVLKFVSRKEAPHAISS